MNNFPYFNQWGIKVKDLDPDFFDKGEFNRFIENFIKEIGVTIVSSHKHSFPLRGETSVFVLSQSHLIAHTWPEERAFHIDLMTCSDSVNTVLVEEVLSKYGFSDIKVSELNY